MGNLASELHFAPTDIEIQATVSAFHANASAAGHGGSLFLAVAPPSSCELRGCPI